MLGRNPNASAALVLKITQARLMLALSNFSKQMPPG
jgi:hypothetical protein